MSEIHEQIPTTFRKGDTVSWYHEDADFSPDDGWALSYSLLYAGGKVTVTGSDNGDGRWLCTLAAASNTIDAGAVVWVAHVSKDDDRYTVKDGRLTVTPDLADSGTTEYDGRTHIQIVLAALEAALESRATSDQLEMSIGDKSIKLMTLDQLIQAKLKYEELRAAEIRTENAKQGNVTGTKARVRFV